MFYDPMIAKLAACGANRAEAIDRMRRALSEFVIAGELTTNLAFHRWIMTHPRFIAGDFDTNFIAQEYHPGAAGEGRRSRSHCRDAAGSDRGAAQRESQQRPDANANCRNSAGSAWRSLAALRLASEIEEGSVLMRLRRDP